MTVSIEFFPFIPGGSATPVATGTQFGNATLVPADGSALAAVVFPAPFATVVKYVGTTIDQITRIGTDELTIQVSSVTLTGFNVYVAGGLPGSTVTVYWTANGS